MENLQRIDCLSFELARWASYGSVARQFSTPKTIQRVSNFDYAECPSSREYYSRYCCIQWGGVLRIPLTLTYCCIVVVVGTVHSAGSLIIAPTQYYL